MPFIIIGSRALPKELRTREPLDHDYIATPQALESDFLANGKWDVAYPADENHYILKNHKKGLILDVEIAWPGSTGEGLMTLTKAHPIKPEELVLMLKLSHRFKASPHFQKTMQDIKWLRYHGVTVPEFYQTWLKWRTKETLAYHKHPVLDQKSKEFFTDNVPYVYVHDTIHLAMARVHLHPAYKDFQQDGAEVKVSKDKWLALPEVRKMDSVLEESYVLALERHQIPNNFRPDPDKSFRIALEKVCTTISSGWWREWAWEHYDDAIRLYNRDYVKIFQRGIAEGVVVKEQ